MSSEWKIQLFNCCSAIIAMDLQIPLVLSSYLLIHIQIQKLKLIIVEQTDYLDSLRWKGNREAKHLSVMKVWKADGFYKYLQSIYSNDRIMNQQLKLEAKVSWRWWSAFVEVLIVEIHLMEYNYQKFCLKLTDRTTATLDNSGWW